MEQFVYRVKDVVADSIGPLYNAVNDKVAIRMFDDLLKENRHKEDFELWLVGKYSDKKPDVMQLVPRFVMSGDHVEKNNGQKNVTEEVKKHFNGTEVKENAKQ